MKRFTPVQVFIPIIAFFLGIGTIIGYNYLQKNRQNPPEPMVDSPNPTPIILSPPSQARTGLLTQISGEVRKIPWDSTDRIPVATGAVIYQGDELQLSRNTTAVITIPSIQIQMKSLSEIVFSNLLPGTLTVRQKYGSVEYKNESSEIIAIRAAGTLIEIGTGHIDIEMDVPIVRIRVISGNAKLGYVNSNNTTSVWQLQPGETAEIDDDTGTVTTSGNLLTD